MLKKAYVYKKRLLKLADFLDKLPPERFNFRKWAGEDWKGKANLSCGTTACALGWATTIPSFRKAGLRLAWNQDAGRPWPCLEGDYVNSESANRAAESIFGVFMDDEFAFLFIPSSDEDVEIDGRRSLPPSASAKDVAEQIRHYVKYKYP